MSDPSSTYGEDLNSPEDRRQSRRDRWASTWAAFLTANHFIALTFVFGWFYWIVPRLKFQMDDFGIPLTGTAIMLIQQSDFIVNYWYLLPLIGIPLLVGDFFTMQWMSKQLGLTRALLFAVCVTIVILMTFAYGHYVLSEEIGRLQKMVLEK